MQPKKETRYPTRANAFFYARLITKREIGLSQCIECTSKMQWRLQNDDPLSPLTLSAILSLFPP